MITTSRDPFAKQELLLKAAPGENIDPAVEDFLLDLADDFIDSVTSFACKLAAHRRSDIVEIDDIMVRSRLGNFLTIVLDKSNMHIYIRTLK